MSGLEESQLPQFRTPSMPTTPRSASKLSAWSDLEADAQPNLHTPRLETLPTATLADLSARPLPHALPTPCLEHTASIDDYLVGDPWEGCADIAAFDLFAFFAESSRRSPLSAECGDQLLGSPCGRVELPRFGLSRFGLGADKCSDSLASTSCSIASDSSMSAACESSATQPSLSGRSWGAEGGLREARAEKPVQFHGAELLIAATMQEFAI